MTLSFSENDLPNAASGCNQSRLGLCPDRVGTESQPTNEEPSELSLPDVSNPFATRYTRPNAGQYLFLGGSSTDSLLERLRKNDWWGQITGPHGSGKSTLVYTLLPGLQAAGRRVEVYSLHLPARWRDSIASWNAATQIVVERLRTTRLAATYLVKVALPPARSGTAGYGSSRPGAAAVVANGNQRRTGATCRGSPAGRRATPDGSARSRSSGCSRSTGETCGKCCSHCMICTSSGTRGGCEGSGQSPSRGRA